MTHKSRISERSILLLDFILEKKKQQPTSLGLKLKKTELSSSDTRSLFNYNFLFVLFFDVINRRNRIMGRFWVTLYSTTLETMALQLGSQGKQY